MIANCCLSANQHRIFGEKPDIFCAIANSVCHYPAETYRKDNHNQNNEAAFGNVMMTKRPNCDASVAYTISMCLISSLDNRPVEAPVTCYDYDSLNKNDFLASGTTSAADGCISLSYGTSG